MPAFSHDDVRERTLAVVRSALVDTLIPGLGTPDRITTGHVLVRLLDHLIAVEREGERPAGAALRDLVNRTDEASRADLRAMTEAQAAYVIACDPEAAGGVVQMYRGGRSSRAEEEREDVAAGPDLTAASLEAYLHDRFPERGALTVTDLILLPGGMSKQTYKATVRRPDGGSDRFVLRRDFPVSPAEKSVVDEYPMLCALWETGGVPMAEPLWLEADPGVFGTAVMAVAMAEGSNDYSAAMRDPAVARVFANALAGAMARLHALPPQVTTTGPLIEQSARAHVAAEIARWRDGLERWRIGPEPVLDAVFAWLADNIPDQVAPSAIVHGDIGFHNMLLQDGTVTALLDWEFSHVGDPAEDVVYTRFFVEQVMDWADFLNLYEAHGGTRPTAEQEHFYAVWQSARNAAGCVGAERVFLNQPDADPRMGVSGMTFKPRFALDALQRIVGA